MEISEITLSVSELSDCLTNLDVSHATGPDGIPARILKECGVQIAPSLCALLSGFLNFGRFPLEWNSADVTPVHKKDLLEPAENYRPISLLPVVSKVICNRLFPHVSRLIRSLQHGFMRCRSSFLQLNSVLHLIREALYKNKQTDVLYLHFAKALDSFDHTNLVEKLKW